jgi:hypothetical protein
MVRVHLYGGRTLGTCKCATTLSILCVSVVVAPAATGEGVLKLPALPASVIKKSFTMVCIINVSYLFD